MTTSFLLLFFLMLLRGKRRRKLTEIKWVKTFRSFFKWVWLPVSKLCNLGLWVWVMDPRTLDEGGTRGWCWHNFGGCGEAQSPVFIVTLQSPHCISHHLSPGGTTRLWQSYITQRAPKASAAPPWKNSPFMVNFTTSVMMETHQWINELFPWSTLC